MLRAVSVLTATVVAAFSGPLLAMSADDARYIEQEFEGVYSQSDKFVPGVGEVAQSLFRVAHVEGTLLMAFSRTSLEPAFESVDRDNRSVNFRLGEGGRLATLKRMGGMAVLTTPTRGTDYLTFVRRPASDDYDELGVAFLMAKGYDASAAEGIVAGEPAQVGPSFDCSQAGTDVERMICGSDRLSELDRALSSLYGQVVSADGDEDFWRNDQRQWIEQRNDCRVEACMTYEYQQRLEELGDVVNYLSKPTEFQ
ncbi:lysozyme inhibitor LprI family protein [Vreelandella indica]|uniref:lysozyme inhibitor LprI family protein n=1 Tax=Vreelandella indica TaxID=3126500 RepID=UPI00300DD94B